MSQLGLILRDHALDRSKRGREQRIAAVRDDLSFYFWGGDQGKPLTGDDVCDSMERLGFLTKENRWAAHVLKGWPLVVPTDQFVPSRRPSSHCRPIRIWRWK